MKKRDEERSVLRVALAKFMVVVREEGRKFIRTAPSAINFFFF